jgi:hypothetical protein
MPFDVGPKGSALRTGLTMIGKRKRSPVGAGQASVRKENISHRDRRDLREEKNPFEKKKIEELYSVVSAGKAEDLPE